MSKAVPLNTLLCPLRRNLYHRFMVLTILYSAFFHKKSFAGNGDPYVGQAVSFVFEQGPKGAAAVKVKEEEGGVAEAVEDATEEEREFGKVKVLK